MNRRTTPTKHFRRLAGIRRRTLIVAVALMAPLAALGAASSASAGSPTGDFAIFSDCPLSTPHLADCIFAETTSGEVTIGSSKVPIDADKKHEIVLQGGYTENQETEAQSFVGAADGKTLSKTPQNVPGGLAGLINCEEISEPVARLACKLVFENKLTGVTATTELAKPASAIGISTNNLINREGIALTLPVKVKLDNPLLGGECYIGSGSSPVTLNLTTGTTSPPAPNTPISGKSGSVEFKDEFSFVKITGNSLVDNAFSAPEATGCGGLLASAIDPVIDSKLGLPSAAGKNTAILNGTNYRAVAEAVIASEK
jgi:hypothetical protein